jgi:hypothetical protein
MNEYNPGYDDGASAVEPAFSVSHLVATLKAYRAVIVVSLISVAIGYLLIASAVYLFSPSERTTSQTFRLQFEGAAQGLYPNGLRFSPTDIIATPILLSVFQENHIERFMTFNDFSKGVFVLEANPDFEKLGREYAARLADTKLSTVDRQRLEAEFELKRQSIPNNEYSLNFTQVAGTKLIPDLVVRRLLITIFNKWASYVVKERHALDFNIALMAPESIENMSGEPDDLIIRIQILRSKILRAIGFVDQILKQPGAGMAKTADGSSADDVRADLSDILRYRIDPVMSNIRSSGLVSDVPAMLRFLESQLAHDERELKSLQSYADATRAAIATLDNRVTDPERVSTPVLNPQPEKITRPLQNETLMPQLGDNFLDRLVDLTNKAQNGAVRQKLVADYRRYLTNVVPAQQAVAYDTQVISDVRSGTNGTSGAKDRLAVTAEINGVKTDARKLLEKANELYRAISRMLVPTSELATVTSPPVTRTIHGVDFKRLALFGILVMLLALPLTILGCLLHNRVIEEERQEESLEGSPALPV